MGRKAKKVDKEGPFQERLRIQFEEHCKSQDELASALQMSRQSVAGWLNGQSIPDISALEKMARLFGVSADYLLGLSDTESPDVSVRAAMAYTGLSEDAVQWLHLGLDDFECDGVGLSEQEKKENLTMASILIQSRAFTKIIYHLKSVAEEAYLERILKILNTRYSEDASLDEAADFRYANKADREIVKKNLIHVFNQKEPQWGELIPKPLDDMDDEELASEVIRALLSARDANERHQFHAAKAFTGVIDQLVKHGRQKAEARFPKN